MIMSTSRGVPATAVYAITGSSMATAVTISEISTVLRRPILFINTPVGTEKIRNQKNTMEVNRFAWESDRLNSGLT